MNDYVHVMVSDYTDLGIVGVGIASPQVPALVAGFDEEVSRESLANLLVEAGAPSEFTMSIHRQKFFTDGLHEWFVRVADDHRAAQRIHTLSEFEILLSATRRPILEADQCSTGEAIFVMVLPEDSVDWLSGQIGAGEVLTLVLDEGDGLVTMALFGNDVEAQRPTMRARRGMTVADLRASVEVEVVEGPHRSFLSQDTVGSLAKAPGILVPA